MSETIIALIIVVAIFTIITIIVVVESKRCPKCKKLGLEFDDEIEKERYNTTKKVEDVTKDKNGNVIKRTEKIIPVTMVVYEIIYKCKYCGQVVVSKKEKEL